VALLARRKRSASQCNNAFSCHISDSLDENGVNVQVWMGALKNLVVRRVFSVHIASHESIELRSQLQSDVRPAHAPPVTE
jgi:hypothetical protein